MGVKLLVSLLVALVTLVVCQQQAFMSCPNKCNYPKNKVECIECLNNGYSDVVKGKGGLFMGDRRLWNKMDIGAHSDWEDGQCWIYIKGNLTKDECHEIGPMIFGQNRCAGFDKASWKVLTKKCWAKFKTPK